MSTIIERHSLVPLGSLLGPWFIGIVLSSIVFGVYLYYTKFCSRDTIFMKLFVAVLMALDIVHLGFIVDSYYVTSVTNFGDYMAIAAAPWTLQAQIGVGVLLSTLVQMFYASRIWTLSNRSWYMPLTIVVCSLAQLALAIVYMEITFKTATFEDSGVEIPFTTGGLAFEVTTDALISGSMIYFLAKSRTGFRPTDKALKTLIAYAVNSGLLLMIIAICCLATFVSSATTSLTYALFFFILVRLYGCSLMSMYAVSSFERQHLMPFSLNSRDHVRDQLFAQNVDHAMVTIPSYTTGDSPGQSGNTKPADESVIVMYNHGVKESQGSYV
ncbi:hypothetical protein C8R43DRAFT_1124492 [Mycena crocata]|nr:hypothetical protein C8R43DRAFT_1124492 [Mycena crocata]